MRESPWNAKRGTQPAAKPFTPEGAQVKHIPRHPPRAEQRPTARRKGRKEALIRQMEAQAAKPQPKPGAGAPGSKCSVSPFSPLCWWG